MPSSRIAFTHGNLLVKKKEGKGSWIPPRVPKGDPSHAQTSPCPSVGTTSIMQSPTADHAVFCRLGNLMYRTQDKDTKHVLPYERNIMSTSLWLFIRSIYLLGSRVESRQRLPKIKTLYHHVSRQKAFRKCPEYKSEE